MTMKTAQIVEMLESALMMCEFADRDEVLQNIYHECEVVHAGDATYKTVSNFVYSVAAVLHIKETIRQCIIRSHELEMKAS